MTKTAHANYLKEVRAQYEQYPYPPRNPETEKTQLQYAHSCMLDVLNHYHYCGTRDVSKHFRILIAGGGTGDSAMFFAEQLRGSNSEIVYVDISETSMALAKKRAEIRGLDNIRWVHGSLLDLSQLVEGEFDLIDCAGVLHHLEKPEAGLAALTQVMKDDGVLNLMLYARYGREMIYRMQDIMRLLNGSEPDMQARVDNCKLMIGNLPNNGAFAQLKAMANYELSTCGDASIYDMLLHSHDVAYKVPDLYRFTASAGLDISHMFFNIDRLGNQLFNPETYIHDPKMLPLLARMSLPDRQALAEILHGNIMKHTFYAVKKGHVPVLPSVDDLGMVPYFNLLLGDEPESYQRFFTICNNSKVGDVITTRVCEAEIRFVRTPNVLAFFKYLDGKRTLREIFEAVRAEHPAQNCPPLQALHDEFKPVYESFNNVDWLLLKAPGIPPLRSIRTIIQEVTAKYTA